MACDCGYPGGPECPPGHPSPILIDLAGTGFDLTGPAEGVLFDIQANGKPVRLAWTSVGSRTAFLVLDRDGNGRIDNGAELFGNFTAQPASPNPNGFIALAEFDKAANGGDGDGMISAADSIFNSLRLWVDANHNGVSEPEELFTLASHGVNSIALDYKESRRTDQYGNEYRFRSKVNGPGQSDVARWAVDVFLATAPRPRGNGAPAGDPPGTILGSEHPEQIPDDVVRGIFLRVAACADDATPLQKKKCGLVRKAVGLDSNDSQKLEAELTAFLAEVTPLDRQITDLHRSARAITDATLKASLFVQGRDRSAERDRRIKDRAAALRNKLTTEGLQRLDTYVAAMKSKIKVIPALPSN
ncbi:MAG TPA: hypothetical protein VFA60_07555 [Terriglobales bacterium]|nr:hypothetical protein [Terriglobales bacterium]